MLDTVHDIARATGTPVLTTQAHLQAGAIHVMAGNWTEALVELEAVVPGLPTLVAPERCAAHINRGLAHVSLLELDRGREDLEAALDLATTHGLRFEEFKARHNLGCLAYLAGDIPGALHLLGEAAALDVGITSARGHLDHAKVLLEAGLIAEAQSVLEQGLDASRQDRQPMERGEIHAELARVGLLGGDHVKARKHASLAARTFRSLRATGRTEEVELLGAAIDLGAGRNLGRAAEVAARWGTSNLSLPAQRLATRIRVEVALAHADLEGARAELRQLDEGANPPLGIQLHELLLAARLALAEGDRPGATARLREAAERLARDQGSVHSFEVRAGLAFHARRIREVDVVSAADSGTVEELFESVERWRASSQRTPPLRPVDDEHTANLIGQLRQLRRSAGAELGRDLLAEEAALQHAITERLRAVPGVGDAADVAPSTCDQAKSLARERDTVLVTFHEDRDSLVRLVVDHHGIAHSNLGHLADIAVAVERATSDARAEAVARPSMAGLLARARESSMSQVDHLLLDGIPHGRAVVLVPTVGLAALPWRALPSLRDRAVVAAPSVTAWARRATTSHSILTVRALAGPGLARSREEVDAVTEVWGRHTGAGNLTEDSPYAGSADVRSALSSASVVHLAAHGRHVDQSPLFSSLDMADGPVFAHELRAPLSAELVVLSACDVGRSRGRPGDEPLGLAAALLSLGVQCVVAATIPVPDDVAATAMIDLHQQLVDGIDVATALRHTAARVPGADAFCAYGNTWSRA